MNSIPKLIRRFFGIFILSVFLLLFLNLALLIFTAGRQLKSQGGWATADTISAGLTKQSDGPYVMDASAAAQLKTDNAWAVLIDGQTLQITWHSDFLPKEIPSSYSVADIAYLSRAYLRDYPTATSSHPDGLLVVGFPKDRFWKLVHNTYDYQLIADFPKTALLFICMNFLLMFLIYMAVTTRLLGTIKPIIEGIKELPGGQHVFVRESGLFSEIARAVNRTSEKLRMQETALRRQEQARANWIAGVSHDIRTPLSMIMGYAGQLEESPMVPESMRSKASVIREQSIRMKHLINDLNLASKLEYNMQPLHTELNDIIPIIRQTVVDALNMDLENRYPIDWETDESLSMCMSITDKDLIRRAVSNLLVNTQTHNPQGCTLHLSVSYEDETCSITVEDNGVGVTDEQLEELNTVPHYMICDSRTDGQRHGLGLMIVKQIAMAHGGSLELGHSKYGGFLARIKLPAFLS